MNRRDVRVGSCVPGLDIISSISNCVNSIVVVCIIEK